MTDVENSPAENAGGVLSTPEVVIENVSPPPLPKDYNRQVSVSEATEIGGRGKNAPWFLKWFEFPFQVSDPQTKRILPEATGWCMDSVGRGPLNLVGSYVGSAVLRLATIEAGCMRPASCSNKVQGFKPSSLLTVMTSIIGVISAILMPIVGAVVDHTRYRRAVGFVSAFLATALIGAQIWIGQSNWFGMLIIDAIQSFCYLVHTTAVFAYLPDLSLDQQVISHYTSRFNLWQCIGQFIFTSLVLVCGQARDMDPKSVASSVQTASDATGIAFGFGALFLGYAWIFLFRERPPLSEVPKNDNLLNTGFKRIGKTSRQVWKRYVHLRWFMASLLFSPEAGAGVVLSIAVTFLTVFMNFSGTDIAMASLFLMIGSMAGSLFSTFIVKWINPLNSYRLGLFSMGFGIGLSGLVFTGPERKDAAYGMSVLWGIAMGWTYPSQRVLFCTLIPKGQETEYMGLFVFVGQILGWLPSLLFTAMNENDVNLRWGLPMVSFFCFAAVFLTLPMGSYENAVKMVAEDSREKLKQIVDAASNHSVRNRSDDHVFVTDEDEGDLLVAGGSTAYPDSVEDEHTSAPIEPKV